MTSVALANMTAATMHHHSTHLHAIEAPRVDLTHAPVQAQLLLLVCSAVLRWIAGPSGNVSVYTVSIDVTVVSSADSRLLPAVSMRRQRLRHYHGSAAACEACCVHTHRATLLDVHYRIYKRVLGVIDRCSGLIGDFAVAADPHPDPQKPRRVVWTYQSRRASVCRSGHPCTSKSTHTHIDCKL